VLVTASLAVGMLSCGTDGTGVDGTGSIEVGLNMAGSDLDPDGVAVWVDGRFSRPVEPGGSVTFTGLEPGPHSVSLEDLAANCAVSGENPRTVSVVAGQTAETTFEVACSPLRGVLEVQTLTVGDTLDLDGYWVSLDGVTSTNIGINEALIYSDLDLGSHSVELGDVAVNCQVSGPNPRTVSVDGKSATHIVFNVSCRAALFDRIAFATNRHGYYEIYVMDPDGSNLLRLTSYAAHDEDPAWSPDGTRIAFTSYRDGNPEIYVMDADGTNVVNLTNDAAGDWNPAWSPDGTRIAFDHSSDIYVMDADGTNVVNLTNDAAGDWNPAWSPDGTRIAFESRRDGNHEIYVMNSDGSNPLRLTNHPADDAEPAWSPDGTRIAFSSRRDGNYEIYVMDADGSSPLRLTNDPADDKQPAWSPDGTRIALTSYRDGNYEIYVIDAGGTNLVRLTNQFYTDGWPAWSPGSEQR
jgi:hypothetical protein